MEFTKQIDKAVTLARIGRCNYESNLARDQKSNKIYCVYALCKSELKDDAERLKRDNQICIDSGLVIEQGKLDFLGV